MADIDPISAPLQAARGSPLLSALGARWREGPKHFEDVHEAARLRWAANAAYRPRPLASYGERIVAAVQAERAA